MSESSSSAPSPINTTGPTNPNVALCGDCGRFHDVRTPCLSRTADQVQVAIAQLLEENLAELKHIRAALAASGSVSSVQLEQDSKGQIKLTVKAYAGSDVESAGTAAVEEFGRLFRMVEQQQMDGWKQTTGATPHMKDFGCEMVPDGPGSWHWKHSAACLEAVTAAPTNSGDT